MAKPTNTQFAVAVHVLTYLAGLDAARAVSSDELATSVNATPVYVRRVLGPLRQSGLVTSRPGPRGGWELSRPAESIMLDEVWQVVSGDDAVLGIHGPNPTCRTGTGVQRALVAIDADVADAVVARLARLSVGDVLRRATGTGDSASRAG